MKPISEQELEQLIEGIKRGSYPLNLKTVFKKIMARLKDDVIRRGTLQNEKNVLVDLLKKHGEHRGCLVGQKTGYPSEPLTYYGTNEDGVEYIKEPYRFGCTCGLWKALAPYRRSEERDTFFAEGI